MQAKQDLQVYLNSIITHLKSVNLTEKIQESEKLLTHLDNAELIVPVVGGFSAGKSTLINSFLGSSILPTAITPETTLATELRYADSDYLEAVKPDGSVERYAPTDMQKVKENAAQFRFLRLYLNNQNLKEIQPLVLVDMPGFDSPITEHDKAIQEYLIRGTYFVFLTNVEDGTITKTMTSKIESLQEIGKGFTFCLSKTDLRAPSQVQEVKEQIADILVDFDYEDDIVLLDNHKGEALKKILKAIDPNALFKQHFVPKLQHNYDQIGQSINIAINGLTLDQEESQEALEEVQRAIDELEKNRDRTIRDMKLNASMPTRVDSVANAVENALRSNEYQLVETALRNSSALSNEMNDIIRPTLIRETKVLFDQTSRRIIADYKLNIEANFASGSLAHFSLEGNFADELAKNVETNMKSDDFNIQDLSESISKIAAIAGTFLPFLRPILSVITTVFSFIGSLFGKKEERQQPQVDPRQKVRELFQYQIYQQVKQKIRDQLPPVLEQNIEKLIEAISAQFEQQLAQKRNEIQAAIAEKQAQADEIEQKITKLKQAQQDITTLANPILFK